MLTFFVYALACVGVHRIWNFESIFQGPRTWLLRYWWAKPVTCQACNALWIAVLLLPLAYIASAPGAWLALEALAAYPLVRGVLWVYKMASHWEVSARRSAGVTRAVVEPPTDAVRKPAPAEPQPPTDGGCRDCERKRSAIVAEQTHAKGFDRRIVLLTTLSDFSPSYSLTSVICDQARMLADNPRWLVQIWVNENANLKQAPTDLPENVEIRRIVPQVPWADDIVNTEGAQRLERELRLKLLPLGNATIIAHDLIFQSAFVTFAAAIHRLGSMPGFAWLHVCHSAVGVRPPGLAFPRALRYTLPEGHKLLCLNEAERTRLAAYYAAPSVEVLVCPNARDITAFGAFSAQAAEVIRAGRLHLADVVQVYPLSTTRMKDKGVHHVIRILANLGRLGRTTRLVLVNAHANGAAEKAALADLRQYVVEQGLPPTALVVTSEVLPATEAQGVSQAVVRDLFSVSNVFIFPSVSEASPLVLVEAALSGCLIVTNASLPVLKTIVPNGLAITAHFGSTLNPEADHGVTETVAAQIDDVLTRSKINLAKRHVLKHSSFLAVGSQLRSLVEGVPLRGK